MDLPTLWVCFPDQPLWVRGAALAIFLSAAHVLYTVVLLGMAVLRRKRGTPADLEAAPLRGLVVSVVVASAAGLCLFVWCFAPSPGAALSIFRLSPVELASATHGRSTFAPPV